jgi:hypothetical protein
MFSSDVDCYPCSQKAICLHMLEKTLVQTPCHAGEPTLDSRDEVALQSSEAQPGILVSDMQSEFSEADVPGMCFPAIHHDVAWRDFVLVYLCMEWEFVAFKGMSHEKAVKVQSSTVILYQGR